MSKEYNLRINVNKTKAIVFSKHVQNEYISEREKGRGSKRVHLGSKITKDGKNKREILSRIGEAKVAFNSRWKLLK